MICSLMHVSEHGTVVSATDDSDMQDGYHPKSLRDTSFMQLRTAPLRLWVVEGRHSPARELALQ